jgi:hypothetical protein
MERWETSGVVQRPVEVATKGVTLRPGKRGFFSYLFAYQALISAAALRGYAQYFTGAAWRWR